MATNTTNYNFILPGVADPIDADLWGGQLNSNWTNLDGLLLSASNVVTRSVSSGPVSVTTTDRNKIILVDATSGAITVNLLAAATAGDGFIVYIKKVDSSSNAVTIDGNASETIDGATTKVLSVQYDSAVLISDGSNWFVGADSIIPPSLDPSYVTASGSVTVPTGATRARVRVAAGGGGGGPDDSLGSPATDGNDSSLVGTNINLTATGGLFGITGQQGGSGKAHQGGTVSGSAVIGSLIQEGQGGAGGVPGADNGGAQTGIQGSNGGLVEATINVSGVASLTATIGTGGTGGVGLNQTGADGADGWIIIEWE